MPELEKAMEKLIKSGQPIEHVVMDKSELEEMFKDDPFKSDLLKKNHGIGVPGRRFRTACRPIKKQVT